MAQPIRIYVDQYNLITSWPNPNNNESSKLFKMIMLVQELQVPYETRKSTSHKDESVDNFLMPTPIMHDPNTDVKLCKLGTTLLYLIDQYDKDNIMIPVKLAEAQLVRQWVTFEGSRRATTVSGPRTESGYYDRAQGIVHYARGQPDEDGNVRKSWLVGDKMTVADIAFAAYPPGNDNGSNNSQVKEWEQRMIARTSWQTAEVFVEELKRRAEEKKQSIIECGDEYADSEEF